MFSACMTDVIILTGDGFESTELLYPVFRLNAAEDVEATVAAPETGEIKGEVHDIVDDWDTYRVRHGYEMEAELAFEDVDPSAYDGLVIPGGRAPEWIRHETEVEDIVQHFFNADKPVAVTCHGPLILAHVGVLDGRSLTCWPTVGTDVERAGGNYKDEAVVVDKNLVSCPSWAESGPWMEMFIEKLL